jgi:Ca2+-binding EF-hand superfamily protein
MGDEQLVTEGLFAMYVGKKPSGIELRAIVDAGEQAEESDPDKAAAVAAFATILKGDMADMAVLTKPIGYANMTDQEIAACESCCFRLTHSMAQLDEMAAHPERYIEEDPVYRARVHATFNEIDSDHDLAVTWDEFWTWLGAKYKVVGDHAGSQKSDSQNMADARLAFHQMDTNNNGTIDQDELAGILQLLGLQDFVVPPEVVYEKREDLRLPPYPEHLNPLATTAMKLLGIKLAQFEALEKKAEAKAKKARHKKFEGVVPEKVIKSGWLEKRGGTEGNKGFDKRWFTLGDQLLAYYSKAPSGKKTSPPLSECKGCIELGSSKLVERGTTFYGTNRFGFTIETYSTHRVTDANGWEPDRKFFIYAASAQERFEWEAAISKHHPCRPITEVIPVSDSESDGNYIDITFNDYSNPGPECISYFGGNEDGPLYICDIDDPEEYLKVLRQGHMLVNIAGEEIPNNDPITAEKMITEAERPFSLRFWEQKCVRIPSKTGVELGEGIDLSGSNTRSLTVGTINDSIADEFPELREGMILKSLGGRDVTRLKMDDIDLIMQSELICVAEFVPQQAVETLAQVMEDDDEDGDGDGTFDEQLELIEKIKKQPSVPIAIEKFDPDYFAGLDVAEQQDLMWNLNSGLENTDSGMGGYACQPTDYDRFKPFFSKVLAQYHGVAEDAKHKSDWTLDKVRGLPDDKILDIAKFGCEPLSMRVRVGRNLTTFPLPGAPSPGLKSF